MVSVALEYSDDTQAPLADRSAAPSAAQPSGKANKLESKQDLAPSLAGSEGTAGAECLALQDMEILFRAGDTRTAFFRVEAGALLVATHQAGSEADSYRVAQVGEYVGLGFQACHSTTACAINSTTVTCIPFEDLDKVKTSNLNLQLQLTKDVTREFSERKATLIAESAQVEPVKKVARLLLAMSDHAEYEGQAINVVAEALECKFLADLIGLENDVLQDAVQELARAGVLYTSSVKDSSSIKDEVVRVDRSMLATYAG